MVKGSSYPWLHHLRLMLKYFKWHIKGLNGDNILEWLEALKIYQFHECYSLEVLIVLGK